MTARWMTRTKRVPADRGDDDPAADIREFGAVPVRVCETEAIRRFRHVSGFGDDMAPVTLLPALEGWTEDVKR